MAQTQDNVEKVDVTDALQLFKNGADTIYAAKSDLNGYVTTETGKGLSSNDFSNAYKEKLDSVDTSTYLAKSDAATIFAAKSDLNGYVATETGKGLSSNDFTTTEKNKLFNIEDSAQVNVIETVKVNNSALTPTNKAVNIDLANATVKSAAILNSAQSLKVSLNSTSAQSFNGSSAATVIGVGGTLQPAYGGTGQSNLNNVTVGKANSLATAQSLKVSLNSTSAQSFNGSSAATLIGVGGTLQPAYGGTGQTNLSNVTVGAASIPAGFSGRVTEQSWGVKTGTLVTGWHYPASGNWGAITFRGNCPDAGQLSAQVDGYFYQNESQYRCIDESDLPNVTVGAANRDGDGNIIKDFYVSKSEFNAVRFGFRIKKSEADPDTRVEYIYDAAGMSPAKMDFTNGVFDYGSWKSVWFVRDNLPLMLNYDGSVAYYLDPNDYSKKVDGSASDVANSDFGGNAMAQFPLCWVKCYEDDNYCYEIISDRKIDDDYFAYAHTDSSGNIKDYFYAAMFGGSVISNKLRSLSGTSLAGNSTPGSFISLATANGSGWHIGSWSQRCLINSLLFLISKSLNIPSSFGIGNLNSGTSFSSGTLYNKGRFFGSSSNLSQVKIFHVESWWGDKALHIAGFFLKRPNVYIKMTPEGNGYRTSDTSGYSAVSIAPSSGFISQMSFSNLGLIPSVTSGSSNSYFCVWFQASPASSLKWLRMGGPWDPSGAFRMELNSDYSASYADSGASLSFV